MCTRSGGVVVAIPALFDMACMSHNLSTQLVIGANSREVLDSLDIWKKKKRNPPVELEREMKSSKKCHWNPRRTPLTPKSVCETHAKANIGGRLAAWQPSGPIRVCVCRPVIPYLRGWRRNCTTNELAAVQTTKQQRLATNNATSVAVVTPNELGPLTHCQPMQNLFSQGPPFATEECS